MKYSILINNISDNPLLTTQHGLSVFVESDNGKYFFDCGASKAFISNAEILGIDLKDVDYLMLSHAHIDHTGGLPYFLKINSKAKIICSSRIFGYEYFSLRKGVHSLSAPQTEPDQMSRFIFADKDTKIGEINVISDVSNNYPRPKGNDSLKLKLSDNSFADDDFSHELIFVLNNKFVYTGCAHKGILNILNTLLINKIKPQIVSGGFHLLSDCDGNLIDSLSDLLLLRKNIQKDFKNTDFVPLHCTCDKAIDIIFK